MDPKLTMLFLLIGTVIGLSHFNFENLAKMKRRFDDQPWRDIILKWLKP